MNNAPNIRIEVTEGAQIPDPRDRRLLNAWTLAFCVAVVALVTLCATQPEPYLEIVKFLPGWEPFRGYGTMVPGKLTGCFLCRNTLIFYYHFLL